MLALRRSLTRALAAPITAPQVPAAGTRPKRFLGEGSRGRGRLQGVERGPRMRQWSQTSPRGAAREVLASLGIRRRGPGEARKEEGGH